MSARGLLIILAVLACGCEPQFGRRASQVEGTRVLALQATPPEASPNEAVALRALVASPEGTVRPASSLHWCMQRKAVADNNTVDVDCAGLGEFLREIAANVAADGPIPAAIPAEACQTFGSEPLPPPPGEPATRPADPDQSGGYYQPLRVTLLEDAHTAFGRVRIRCALPQASALVAREFRERYVPNRNPTVERLEAVGPARAGGQVTLRLTWSAGSREGYVAYDPAAREVTERTEALRAAWFVPAGELDRDVTLADEGTSSENTWTLPSTPGVYPVWAVLRDDRGGIAWGQAQVQVE